MEEMEEPEKREEAQPGPPGELATLEPFDKNKCIAKMDLTAASIKSMRSTVPPDLKKVGINEKEWLEFIDSVHGCLFPKGLSFASRMGNMCSQPEDGEQMMDSEHFLALVRHANNKFASKNVKLVLESRPNEQTRIVVVKND